MVLGQHRPAIICFVDLIGSAREDRLDGEHETLMKSGSLTGLPKVGNHGIFPDGPARAMTRHLPNHGKATCCNTVLYGTANVVDGAATAGGFDSSLQGFLADQGQLLVFC